MGQVLGGRCEPIDEIGRGRLGTVFRAHDAPLGRLVAAKVMSADAGAEAMVAFVQERRRRFEHPNVVPVLASFSDRDQLVVLTELFTHGTLADLLRTQPAAAATFVTTIGTDLLGALQEMHQQGVLHGDLHAGNVLLAPDPPGLRCVVGDFGTTTQRTSVAARGSADTVAPEVWRGAPADERSDLYAVGVLLRRCIEGAPAAVAVPPAVVELVTDLTATDPAARPADATVALGRIQAAGAPAADAAVALAVAIPPLPPDWSPAGVGAVEQLARFRGVLPPAHPFVARRAELAGLDARLDEGGVVVVVGEAGVGKTRLVREWVDRVDGALVVAGACTADGGELEPWRSLVADTVDALGPDVVAARVDGEVRLEEQLAGGVEEVLRAAAREHPVIAVVEDLHRATPESLAVLSHLVSAFAGEPVLVVGTARPAVALPDDVGRIGLVDLEPADVALLVSAVTGDDRVEVAAAAVRRAGGNPFFVVELARAAVEDGALPETVAQAVLARVDEAGEAVRPVLEVGALLGSSFTVADIAPVVGRPETVVEGALARAAARQLVTAGLDGSSSFTHDLVPESLRGAMSPSQRSALHRAIAAQLEAAGPTSADEIATVASHHAATADASSTQIAMRGYELAWRQATAGAPALAIGIGTSALKLARAVGDESAVARIGPVLAEQCEKVGQLERALGIYAELSPAADPLTTASVVRRHAVALEKHGDYPASIERFEHAISLLGSAPGGSERDHEEAWARLGLAVTWFYRGGYARSRELSEHGLLLAERLGDDRLIAQACLQLEMVCSELSLPGRAEYEARAHELLVRLDLPDKLGNLLLNRGVSGYNDGAWHQAMTDYGDAIKAFERAHDPIGAGIAFNNEAEILTGQGRMREARWKLHEALDAFKGTGYAMGEALSTSGLSRVALHSGRAEEGRRHLDDATEMFRNLESVNFVYDSLVRAVELALYTGDLDGTSRLIAEARAMEGDIGDDVAIVPITLTRLEAVLAWVGEDRVRAADLLGEAEERARAKHFLSELALVLHAIVETGARSDRSPADELATLNESLGIVWLPPLPVPAG